MEKYTIVHKLNDESKKVADRLDDVLKMHGQIRDDDLPEVIFVVGGDGTFLYAVNKYIDELDKVKLYGIHTGTLGFFADYKEEDFDTYVNQYFDNKLHEDYYPLLEIDTDSQKLFALNEMRIENVKRTQALHITINDEYFEDFRGTGVCICTQLGSTAYNRSLKGAVIVEGVDLIEMSEIAGIHHNKFRSLGAPIVMKGDTKIELLTDDFSGATLGIDSNVYNLDGTTKIVVKKSETKKVSMLRGRHISYFTRLQSLF